MKTSTFLPLRLAAVLTAAFLAVAAPAQTTTLKHADKSFIEKAAKASMAEVDISRVALERSTNPQVKELAQMVIDDHSRANDALSSIALTKGVTLPAKDMDDTNKWSKKSGKDFDEDYIEKMVSAHKDAVELFEKQANKGGDLDTKTFARDTLPKLQHHLQMALDLKKTVK
jgi:putative membrane protein